MGLVLSIVGLGKAAGKIADITPQCGAQVLATAARSDCGLLLRLEWKKGGLDFVFVAIVSISIGGIEPGRAPDDAALSWATG